jgi:hypothetical protein
MGSNERSGFVAREVKRIKFDNKPLRQLKFAFGAAFRNSRNIDCQVAITNMAILAKPTAVMQDTLDALLADLMAWKEGAASVEEYALAEEYKRQHLVAMTSRTELLRLFAEKQAAVAREDFAGAARAFREINVTLCGPPGDEDAEAPRPVVPEFVAQPPKPMTPKVVVTGGEDTVFVTGAGPPIPVMTEQDELPEEPEAPPEAVAEPDVPGLSEAERSDWAAAIRALGEPIVAQALSSRWKDRVDGYTAAADAVNDENWSDVWPLLQHGFGDKLVMVYVALASRYVRLFEGGKHLDELEVVTNSAIGRLSDSNQRVRAASQEFVEFGMGADARVFNSVVAFCMTPTDSGLYWLMLTKLALGKKAVATGRVKVVDALAIALGGLQSKRADCRGAATELVRSLDRAAVEKAIRTLPADVAKLYREKLK